MKTATIKQDHELLDIPWIGSVRTTDMPESEHRVFCDIGSVRPNTELHTVENMGYTVQQISRVGNPNGLVLYVSER